MNRLACLFAASTLVIAACGQSKPASPPIPPPAAAPAAPAALAPDTAAAAAAAAPAVAPWDDLHKLHEPMEENGDQMKALRTALRAGDLAKALQQTERLATSMKDVRALATGFTGETPDRFRAFADSAVVTSEALRSALTAATATGAAPADPAALNSTLESLRGSCKSCHEVYKKED